MRQLAKSKLACPNFNSTHPKMQLNMIRNGYNFERRKMYPSNPRNNLVSTVDLIWNESLLDQNQFSTTKLKNKIQHEKQAIRHHYNELIGKAIQQEKSLDKNSFRILPSQRPGQRYQQNNQFQTNKNNLFASRRQSLNIRQGNLNTINRQGQGIRNYRTNKSILQPILATKELRSSGKLSRTVFGYEINPQNFKRESYLSKMLSDRLEPYLQQAVSGSHRRHKSVMANQVIDLNY